MPQDYRSELDELLQSEPARDEVGLPVTPRIQELPLNALSWENFERLCARLIASDHDIVDCHRYGVRGDAQAGIDIMAYRHVFGEGRREFLCYQCKRWQQMTPADLHRIVLKFTYPADRYVIMVSLPATAALRDVVAGLPNVDLWDAEDICNRLKDQPELVEDFFGVHWRDSFSGPVSLEATGGGQRPPEAPYLHWVIGRDAEKQGLLAQYSEVKRTKSGTTVFLMGQQGSGRRALAEWMKGQAHEEQGDAVAALRFLNPGTLPPQEVARFYWAGSIAQEYGPRIVRSFPQTSRTIAGGPWVNLAAQLLKLSAQADKTDTASYDAPDDPRALHQLVRKAARRRSLLLIVEYLDWADPLWIDLLRALADEIAQDLPVLLLVTLSAAAPLDALSRRQHTEPTRLAEELVKHKLAHSYYLGPVTASEIAASIAPADPRLGERLHQLSDGDPLIVQTIWEEWVEQGAVLRDEHGVWCVSPTGDGQWWVYGDVRDHARSLLSDLLKGREVSPPFSLGQVERILNCAAVEGETFTAPAVARVMDVDPDDLIDFFDDWLVAEAEDEDLADEGEAYKSADGILVDEGFVEVDSQRHLCQYRFARPYLHHVWAKYPRDDEQRRAWSSQLADELERFYYPLSYLIADELFDLFGAAGLLERAEPYRRQRAVKSSLEGLLWHVRLLIETTSEDDRFGIYRLFDRGFALSDRLAVEHPDMWEEGYRIVQELGRRAVLVGDVGRQASAHYYMAWHQFNAGHYTEALSLARRAVQLYHEGSGPQSADVAGATNMVGSVLRELGDRVGARAAHEQALAIFEHVLGPDHPNVATLVTNLGLVLRDLGKLGEARAALERALVISERVYGQDHPSVASGVNTLGLVLQDLGELAGARAAYERALAIDERVYGPEHPRVATDVNNLGSVLHTMGDLAGARAALERALAIDERVSGPDHPHVARDVSNLGGVLQAMGDLAGARAAYERALAIEERVFGPNHPHVARDVNNLGDVLQAMGDLAGARAALGRALSIALASGTMIKIAQARDGDSVVYGFT